MATKPAKKRKSTSRKRGNSAADVIALEGLDDDWETVSMESVDGAKVIVLQARKVGVRVRGTTVAAVRMSTADKKSGFTVAAQLQEVLAFAQARNLRVGHVVVSMECSGARDYIRRPDLLAIEWLIVEGHCTSIVWREVSRISRDRQTFLDFAAVMRATKTDVYISQTGKTFDWENASDCLVNAIMLELGVVERELTKMRTTRGVWQSRVVSGKGVFPQPLFGFMKDEDGWLVPCPKMWKWATFAHSAYRAIKLSDTPAEDVAALLAECDENLTCDEVKVLLGDGSGASGLRALERVMNAVAVSVTSATLNNVLRDSIYVDGRFAQTFAGISIGMKQINLDEPLDPECFATNQRLLDQPQGTWSHRRVGEVLLTGKIRCGECGEAMRMDSGKRDGTLRYRCTSTDGKCSRPAIDVTALDRKIVRLVRDLDASDDMLVAAWHAADEARRAAVEKMEQGRIVAGLNEKLDEANARFDELMSVIREDPDIASPEEVGRAFAERGGMEAMDEIARLKRAIETRERIVHEPRHRPPLVVKPTANLRRLLRKKLPLALPKGREDRLIRAAIIRDTVSAVVVTPDDVDSSILHVRIEGSLTPIEKDLHFPVHPSSAARATLESHARTVNPSYDYLTVRAYLSGSTLEEVVAKLGGGDIEPASKDGVSDWIVEIDAKRA